MKDREGRSVVGQLSIEREKGCVGGRGGVRGEAHQIVGSEAKEGVGA